MNEQELLQKIYEQTRATKENVKTIKKVVLFVTILSGIVALLMFVGSLVSGR